MGIDPGTNVMGYGIIEINGATIKLLSLGVIKLSNLNDHALKLKKIFEQTYSLLEQYKPDELAIEAPFFGKNVQSMLKLGQAQGVAIAAALSRSVPVFEYSPRKIKQSITGKGSASKEQVASMLPEFASIRPASSISGCDRWTGSGSLPLSFNVEKPVGKKGIPGGKRLLKIIREEVFDAGCWMHRSKNNICYSASSIHRIQHPASLHQFLIDHPPTIRNIIVAGSLIITIRTGYKVVPVIFYLHF